jgi:hypothetical protein
MLIQQILNEDPLPPRSLEDKLPRDLEMICLKAMSKEPRHRYASAAEFEADLQRYLRREPVCARPVSLLERMWLWCRRPDRIGTASTITVSMALMLALWELQSLVLLALGVVRVADPLITATTIVLGMLFFAGLAGLGTLSRHRIKQALWLGSIVSVGLLSFSLTSLLGYIRVPGLVDASVRVPVFGFFFVAATFIVVSHAVSLLAFYSNRNTMRWSRAPIARFTK